MNTLIRFAVVVMAFFFTSIVVVASLVALSLFSLVQKCSRKKTVKHQDGSIIDGEYEIVYEK